MYRRKINRSRRLLLSGLSLLLGLGFVAAGLALPVHLRSVSDAVLQAAAREAPGDIRQRIRDFSDRALVGPLRLVLASDTLPASFDPSAHQARVDELLETRPRYYITGGPEPYFEGFLQLAEQSGRLDFAKMAGGGAIGAILPGHERRALLRFLEQSSNRFVHQWLDTRSVRGWIEFPPADSPAGAPMDATLLLGALFAQGNYWTPDFSETIRREMEAAVGGDAAAIARMEGFALDFIYLARRFDFRQLATLVGHINHPRDLGRFVRLLREKPDATANLFTLLLVESEAAATLGYLETFPEGGLADLLAGARIGDAAVAHLVETGLPRHRMPEWLPVEVWAPFSAAAAPGAYRYPWLFKSLKLGAVFLGVLLLFESIRHGLAVFRRREPMLRQISGGPLLFIRNVCLALFGATLFWALTEPAVLENPAGPPPTELRLDLSSSQTLESFASPLFVPQNMNNVTLLILALFFVIQFVIYLFCVIKIREIARQAVSPAVKLRLLENEDNLFDFGLYVGLGGTVLSLILVVVGIIEASLMVAYASTLFGILFVAFVKIVHLRALRRHLILQDPGALDR